MFAQVKNQIRIVVMPSFDQRLVLFDFEKLSVEHLDNLNHVLMTGPIVLLNTNCSNSLLKRMAGTKFLDLRQKCQKTNWNHIELSFYSTCQLDSLGCLEQASCNNTTALGLRWITLCFHDPCHLPRMVACCHSCLCQPKPGGVWASCTSLIPLLWLVRAR